MLVSCFNYYDIRLKHIEEYLQDRGYSVTYITSDYDHIGKKKLRISRDNAVQVHALPYKKNLSIRRLLSHMIWSRSVYSQISNIKPDLQVIMLPPNSLAKRSAKYRNRFGGKLLFDIYDMWPETYPLSTTPALRAVFEAWRRRRDNYLTRADYVTTECDLFREKLVTLLGTEKISTLYPAIHDSFVVRTTNWDDSAIRIAYLGSINNIIDIPRIVRLLESLQKIKQTILYIVGAGESKSELISRVERVGVVVEDFGPVFDEQRKQEILDKCRFGLNIMRETVFVGLTMKSLDYMRAGLPMLNNIKSDSAEIIAQRKLGFNLSDNDDMLCRIVGSMTETENNVMRENCRRAYEEVFSSARFREAFDKIYLSALTVSGN